MTRDEFTQRFIERNIQMDIPAMVALLEQGDISVSDVFEISVENVNPQSWLACWVLNHYIDKHPHALEPMLGKAVEVLPQVKRTGLVRLLLRCFMVTPQWNFDNLGLLLDFSLAAVRNNTFPVAVKANAMCVLERIAKDYPDVSDEIKLVVQEQLPYLSAGGKNRALKLLNDLP